MHRPQEAGLNPEALTKPGHIAVWSCWGVHADGSKPHEVQTCVIQQRTRLALSAATTSATAVGLSADAFGRLLLPNTLSGCLHSDSLTTDGQAAQLFRITNHAPNASDPAGSNRRERQSRARSGITDCNITVRNEKHKNNSSSALTSPQSSLNLFTLHPSTLLPRSSCVLRLRNTSTSSSSNSQNG